MKLAALLTALLVGGFIGATAIRTAAGEAGENEKTEQSKLQAEAKISKADAETIAQAKVPGGKVKEAELENEDGRLVWSFDFGTAGTKDITEVLVDAKTGAVVSVEKESPEDEAKELAGESGKEKEHNDKD